MSRFFSSAVMSVMIPMNPTLPLFPSRFGDPLMVRIRSLPSFDIRTVRTPFTVSRWFRTRLKARISWRSSSGSFLRKSVK
jgi:hypothetical protein